MNENGLVEVENPSELFLAERQNDITGSTIFPSLEGTRPILVEVQALVSHANFGTPQRNVNGFDFKRIAMLLAVLEKSEIFGEMGLIDGLPRSATVTAREDCVMSVCSQETFNNLADHNPESLIPIFKVLVGRLRSTLALVETLQQNNGNSNGSLAAKDAALK